MKKRKRKRQRLKLQENTQDEKKYFSILTGIHIDNT